ncbi:hypothetical protein BS50DRAFT_235655 [Corynespora cassiicola Philippines]|uniref:Cell wall protein PhiA n=1 Tax=Corynespora cassiicola Philippines TaxID=1448308 RepID=A0A2T2P269_CORCC|nr:hypothetical protein BS50DRAFT_235655 [Corynespora cassiicola Philippines]
MRLNSWAFLLLGVATAASIERRGPPKDDDDDDDKKYGSHWRPKTKTPHFFNIKINDQCGGSPGNTKTLPEDCKLQGYAVRLEKGIAIATPYNKWWDYKLPTFFVDDDTQLYTVSKDPLQLYIDSVTGALKYTKVGWIPPSAISTSFYHTGNNPLGLVDPSPSFLTWPSTKGIAFYGEWLLCPLGGTGQYQIFVNNLNFEQQGVEKDYCINEELAAVNANPWKKKKGSHGHYDGHYGGHDDDHYVGHDDYDSDHDDDHHD